MPPQQAALSFDNDYAKRLIQSNVAQDVGQQRGQWAAPAQVASGLDEPPVEVGPFVPLWVSHTDAPPSLYYFRRVAVGSAELMQGFLVDWSKLCELLRQQIADLVAGATIEAVGVGGEGGAPSTSGAALVANVADASDTRLATIPARLAAKPCEPISAANGLTPARATLGAAWLALLAAIVAAGVSLHATAADAARRARFAGAVTHELRTPLTTFQLYTDMLVDDMVPPERRAEYLETLRDESQRLGHLVENVLSYARIEQGRYAARLEPTPVADLMARVVQPLQRRADSAGLTLRMDNALADPNRLVTTDPESVERILFNLVDNAAKYASGGADPVAADTGVLTLRLDEAAGDASRIRISVVDHGPGVSTTQAARLFQPFERGSDDHTQQQRGIGLGLALSRELARAIGGDLMHAPTPGGGATFTLALPA